MTIRYQLVWIFIPVLIAVGARTASSQPQLFWTDTGTLTVEYAKADLTDRSVMRLFVDRPDYVAVDEETGKIYWTDLGFSSDNSGTARRLRRANPDGSEAEILVRNLSAHSGLIVDSKGGRVYWTEPDEQRIRSAKLDGSDVQVFIDEDDGAEYPAALAFDASDRRLFWIDSDADVIRSAKPDGSELTDVMESAGLFGLALDPANQMVYWTVYRDNEIRRAGYDGSGEEVAIETDERPRSLAVDAENKRIYWSSASFLTHALHGSDLDGSDGVDYVEAEEIRSVTVDTETNRVLWTGDGEASASGIVMISPASGESEALFRSGSLRDVEADAAAGYVFWNRGNDLIRTRVDGSEQAVIHEAAFAPQGIDLDRSAQKVYFTSGGQVHRLDYDGGSVEQLTNQGTAGLGDVAVDANNGYVYWIGNSSSTFGFIERANLDGSDRDEILSDLNYPRGLRANPETGTIYWAYGGAFEGEVAGIRSAGANGSDQRDVITTLETPRDLAIDGDDEKLYWTDSGTNRIERANLNGSAVETVVSARLETPDGLSVVPSISTSRAADDALPVGMTLDRAYPNPFNPTASIGFELPRQTHVHLAVYDLLGRRVRVLVDGRRSAGRHVVTLRAGDLSSGTYVYRLEASGRVLSNTLTLIK